METTIVLEGAIFMIGLLVSIGPQNVFVLNTGLCGQHTLEVVSICILGDLLLMAIGVLGMGHVLEWLPELLPALKYLALGMLSFYALSAVHRLANPVPLTLSAHPRSMAVAGACGLTFLNPYVYLDTVFLVGARAALQGDALRWWFAAGAMFSSCFWYFFLGFGGRLLSRYSSRPRFSRWVDTLTLVAMCAGIVVLLQNE